MIRDDFAGPGGWDEGMRLLGLTDVVGVEWDRWACETALAAGHRRVRADVRHIPPGPWEVDGYVASPPCTSFSAAGKGEGAKVLAGIVTAARRVAAGDVRALDGLGGDETTALILEPVRQVRDLRPRWVALEQVPPCLPIWQEYARIFRAWGYSASTAVLCAADFGVPQTRRRAILVARLDGVALLPEPSHSEHPGTTFFGTTRPWQTMAEALGWGFTERPSTTLVAGMNRSGATAPMDGGSGQRAAVARAKGGGQWAWERPATTLASSNPGVVFPNGGGAEVSMSERGYFPWGDLPDRAAWAEHRPATTITGDPRMSPPCHHDSGEQLGNAVDLSHWGYHRPATTLVGSFCPDVVAAPGYRQAGDGPRQDAPGSIRISPEQASVLQSFPADYPWQGGKGKVFEQIGNAVPPRLAAAVVGALLGLPWQDAVEPLEVAS